MASKTKAPVINKTLLDAVFSQTLSAGETRAKLGEMFAASKFADAVADEIRFARIALRLGELKRRNAPASECAVSDLRDEARAALAKKKHDMTKWNAAKRRGPKALAELAKTMRDADEQKAVAAAATYLTQLRDECDPVRIKAKEAKKAKGRTPRPPKAEGPNVVALDAATKKVVAHVEKTEGVPTWAAARVALLKADLEASPALKADTQVKKLIATFIAGLESIAIPH